MILFGISQSPTIEKHTTPKQNKKQKNPHTHIHQTYTDTHIRSRTQVQQTYIRTHVRQGVNARNEFMRFINTKINDRCQNRK